MAPVYENEELHGAGPTQLDDGVQGGANGTAREENIVHEYHVPTGDATGYRQSLAVRWMGRLRKIVAVGAGVEGGDGYLAAAVGGDVPGDAPGERQAAAEDSDQEKARGIGVRFD